MKEQTRMMFTILGVITLVLTLGASQTFASSIELEITNGSSTVTCDTTTTVPCSGLSGSLNFTGVVGNWLGSITGIGNPTNGIVDLDSFAMSTTTATDPGALTILLSEDDVTDYGDFQVFLSETLMNVDVEYQVFYDSGDTLFALTTPVSDLTTTPANITTGPTPSTPYSITEELIVTPLAPYISDSINGDSNVSVPEPSSILLLVTGLIGLGLLGSKRRLA